MLIVLDRGHGDKGRGQPFDPGVVAGPLREVDLAGAYLTHAAADLTALGHTVRICPAGSYDSRHAWAVAEAAGLPHLDGVYVQLHVNAGAGRYGLVEHDARSAWGRTAAATLADALDDLPEVSKTHVWSLDAGDRGWACIDDIYASPTLCGLIYEPGFIDAPAHAALWTPTGLVRLGGALARGLDRFARSMAVPKAA